MTVSLISYTANRRKGMKPADAKTAALAKPVSCGYSQFFTPDCGATRQPDRPNYAWVENAAALGLRFVDFADNITSSIRHKGWYTDDDGDRETLRGAVYRLPKSRGFIAGYVDPINDGAAFIELRVIASDDVIGAAFAADRTAEMEAAKERDYQRAWQARRRYDDLGEEIADTRRACLDLIRDTKAACDSLKSYTAIKATIRARIIQLRNEIDCARRERRELQSEYGREPGFSDA